MMKKVGVITSLLLMSFILVQAIHAHEKVTVVPLMSTPRSLKGDLYYTIPFSQFEPGQETVDYGHYWVFAPVGSLALETGTLAFFNAPVNLPDNAVISELGLSASDESNSSTITIYLMRFSLTAGFDAFIPDNSGVNSSSVAMDSSDLITRAVANEVIDNQNYYYGIYALFSGGQPFDKLKAVRIKYTLP